MLKASPINYKLDFKVPAGTSRGILLHKETWFVKVWDDEGPSIFGLGECAMFRGLSCDDRPEFESRLDWACNNIGDARLIAEHLNDWPSIRFGMETALIDFAQGGIRILHPSAFTQGENGVPINGLIWMASKDEMLKQIAMKLDNGFRCLKLKVGAISFEDELDLLASIRREFSPEDLELRIDANGAFKPSESMEILKKFSDFVIHSIEQPIKAGNPEAMAELCYNSPIPIALDEELIGINHYDAKVELLNLIKPHYIILKPSLHGGFMGAEEWCSLAQELGIKHWYTSALESNIGLNAIAQHVFHKGIDMKQGLGTGSLFKNNIPSPIKVVGDALWYDPSIPWDISILGL